MKKKMIAILVAVATVFGIGSTVAANDERPNTRSQERYSYTFDLETGESEQISQEDFYTSRDGVFSSEVERVTEEYTPPLADSSEFSTEGGGFTGKARENLESYGLLDENGHMDWDAFNALPSLDELAFGEDHGSDLSEGEIPIKPAYGPVANIYEPPYRYVLYLVADWNGMRARGTAYMVSRSDAVTAGHNVFNHRLGGPPREITVFAGGVEGHNMWGSTIYRGVHVGGMYVDYEDCGDDWGFIHLMDPIGNQTGYFGLKASMGNAVGLGGTFVTGFPADASPQMWTESGRITSFDGLRYFYPMMANQGQSGGPIHRYEGGSNYAIGVLNQGPHGSHNSYHGTAINNYLFDLFTTPHNH